MKIFIILPVLLSLLTQSISEGKTGIERTINLTKELNSKNIPKIFSEAIPILRDLYDLWHILLKQPNLKVQDALFRSREHEIIGRIITISDQVSSLNNKVSAITETIEMSILQALPRMIRVESNLRDLQLIINQINFSHDQLRTYLIHGYKNITNEKNYSDVSTAAEMTVTEKKFEFDELMARQTNEVVKRSTDQNWLLEQFTLMDFAVWATGHGFNSLPSLTRRMNDLVLREVTGEGIFALVKDFSEHKSTQPFHRTYLWKVRPRKIWGFQDCSIPNIPRTMKSERKPFHWTTTGEE